MISIATASFGLQGVQTKDLEKVEQVIHETLKTAYQQGFPTSRIENIIHQIELGLKHVCFLLLLGRNRLSEHALVLAKRQFWNELGHESFFSLGQRH